VKRLHATVGFLGLLLATGPLATVGYSQGDPDNYVTSTGTSSAEKGTLPYAVNYVNGLPSGGTVSFRLGDERQTIFMGDSLDITAPTDFVNDNSGAVNVEMNGNPITVGTNPFSLGENIELTTLSAGSVDLITNSGENLTFGALNGSLSAVSYDTATGIRCDGDVVVNGGMNGMVLVLSEVQGVGIHGQSLTINDGFNGIVIAESAGTATGLYGVDGVAINGGINGAIGATAGNGDAMAIRSDNGDVTINGGLSGQIAAAVNNDDPASTSTAYGIYTPRNHITVSGDFIGTIAAEAEYGSAYGIYAYNEDKIEANVTFGDQCRGFIAANASGDFSEAIGISATGDIRFAGGMSGTIAAAAEGNGTAAAGIYSDAEAVTIVGNMGGEIAASGDMAFGIAAKEIHIGNVSGSINVAGSYYAAGLGSSGAVNGGDENTPMIVSGTISAVCLADVEPYAVGIIAHGDANIKVESGAMISAVAAAPPGVVGGETPSIATLPVEGYACAIETAAPTASQIELVAGCRIVGGLFLGGGADSLVLSGDADATALNEFILGAETITASGGHWTLNGLVYNDNPSTLTVTGGTLSVNGLVENFETTVAAGGFLNGVGQLGDLTNYGTVAPGNSIGTMIVAGDYVQAPGSTLEIEINSAGQSDRLDVAGQAQLSGGTVSVLAESGSYHAGQTFTFLTAGTVSGKFDAVTDNLLLFDVSLVYFDDYVQLLLSGGRRYIDIAQTFNQCGVAGYLDDHKGGASGDFADVLTQLDALTDPQARAAFDAMSGELFGSLSTVALENTERFQRIIAHRMRTQSMNQSMDYANAESRLQRSIAYVSRQTSGWQSLSDWNPWVEGYGVGASLAGDGNASGLGYSTGGAVLGLESALDDSTRFGLVGGYSKTHVSLNDRADWAVISSGQVGVYGIRQDELRYLSGIAAYGYNGYDTERRIAFGDLSRRANANYGGNNFSFHLETGRNLHGSLAHWQPFAALEYLQVHQNDFIETGADSINNSIRGINAAAFRSLLGARALHHYRTQTGRMISLECLAAWRHEFLDDLRIIDAMFPGQPGGAFTVAGVNVDRDAAILGAGLSFAVWSQCKLYANYDLLLSRNYAAHAGAGGLQYSW